MVTFHFRAKKDTDLQIFPEIEWKVKTRMNWIAATILLVLCHCFVIFLLLM
jgi:hypothetical protein